jgi:hypothetical protein
MNTGFIRKVEAFSFGIIHRDHGGIFVIGNIFSVY